MTVNVDKSSVAQEAETIIQMIKIYCKGRHRQRTQLCRECEELLAYAKKRLNNCVFGIKKPTCEKCSIHCYKPAMRNKIRAVMRYAGPRMIFVHPIDALKHLIKSRRGLSVLKTFVLRQ